MLPIKVILHPTDFSQLSEHAFQLACMLARDTDARLIVLHVHDRPVLAYAGVAMAPPSPPPSDDERAAIRAQLDSVRPTELEIPVTHRLEAGDPATGILEVARETSCDMIVMGTHGRTGLRRLLMGSVAEKVMHGAICPVVTVKTPLPEGERR
jgi:nucleotide-binding universal stress UspA family protein